MRKTLFALLAIAGVFVFYSSPTEYVCSKAGYKDGRYFMVDGSYEIKDYGFLFRYNDPVWKTSGIIIKGKSSNVYLEHIIKKDLSGYTVFDTGKSKGFGVGNAETGEMFAYLGCKRM